jgi:predicted hydrocarbon binding protein
MGDHYANLVQDEYKRTKILMCIVFDYNNKNREFGYMAFRNIARCFIPLLDSSCGELLPLISKKFDEIKKYIKKMPFPFVEMSDGDIGVEIQFNNEERECAVRDFENRDTSYY